MLQVLRYIFTKNKGIDKLKYVVLGVMFQIFKRVTGSVVSKKIFNGKSLFLYPACNVSSMYAYTDIPEKEEITILRSLVKNEDAETIFLDIGANIGSYSVSMMDICSEVVAFEPHPYTARRCKMNFLLNNYSEDNVQQIALSNHIGTIHFSDYGGSSTINHILGIVFECFSKDEVFDVLKKYGYLTINKLSENNYFATKN